jgi:polyisoprenoid-binding protein YceI
VEFSIHKRLFFLVPMTVTGRFADVQGTIRLDEREPTTARAEIAIGAASIDTRMAKRDKHLRKADFFDVERFPTLTFRVRRVELVDRVAGYYRVTGDLTVRGVTRAVVLDAHYLPLTGEDATRRIRLTLTAPLNRRDFGMDWDRPYIHVADDLTATLTIEATQV